MIVLFPFHRLKKTESWGDCVIAQDPVTCKKQNENLKLRYLNTSSAQVTALFCLYGHLGPFTISFPMLSRTFTGGRSVDLISQLGF